MGSAPTTEPPSRPGPPEPLDPPALREAADAIVREFPLAVRRTALVLYEVDPQRLQAQWQVTADDLNRARGAFPADAAGVRPIVRLLRLDAQDGPREVASLPQPPVKGPLEGEAVFTVGDQGRRFQAELGVESDDGGWLLLARSDAIEPPRSIARPVLARRIPAAERPPEPAPVGVIPVPATVEPALGPTAEPVPAHQAPIPRRADAESQGPPALDPTLAPPAGPLAPEFPNPLRRRADGQDEGRREETARFPIPQPEVHIQVEGQGPRAAGGEEEAKGRETGVHAPHSRLRDPQSDLPPPILPSTLHTWSGEGSLLAHHDPAHGLSSRALHGPEAWAEVELHAELIVWGHAPAGSLVEVMGRSLRVGPDGRFLVRAAVEHPEVFGIALPRLGPGQSESE